jgi:hypothetical protein
VDNGRCQSGEKGDFKEPVVQIVHDDESGIKCHFLNPYLHDTQKGGNKVEEAQGGRGFDQNVGSLQ